MTDHSPTVKSPVRIRKRRRCRGRTSKEMSNEENKIDEHLIEYTFKPITPNKDVPVSIETFRPSTDEQKASEMLKDIIYYLLLKNAYQSKEKHMVGLQS